MLKKFLSRKNKAVRAQMRALTAAFLIYVIAMVFTVSVFGDTLNVWYTLPDGTPCENITAFCSDESVAKVKDISVRGSRACVSVECVGTGETDFKIICGANSSQVTLGTNKLGLLENMASDDIPCWRAVALFTALFFMAVSVICVISCLRVRKEDGFSYLQVADLSLHLFTLFFGGVGLIISLISVFRPWSFTFSQAILFYSNAMIYFAMLTSPLILVFALLLCISNIQLIRKESFRAVNLLGIGISFAIAGGLAFGMLLNQVGLFAMNNSVRFAVINSYFGIYDMFICILVSVFIIFFHISRHIPEYNKDFIIILGCAIRKDGTLFPLIRGRVDKALEFAQKQKQATGKEICFIPSGGKGADEPIAEGRAMADYLISKGIPAERIFPETESRNTVENMKFSVKKAQEQTENPEIIFSTTNYHVFRSGILASGAGYRLDGIGSKTKWYFWPNALIREFFGLLANNKLNFIIFCLITAAVSVLTTLAGK